MPDEVGNVFISHVHEDDAGLGKLKDLLSGHGYTLRDSSITNDRPNDANSPEYIKSEILGPAIQWAGTFLVYITPRTKGSEWVDWEIEYAHRLGKRIVGIWAYGQNECPVPGALEKYADAVVGWTGTKIIEAIEGSSSEWVRPSGEQRDMRPIKRYSC